MMQPDVDLDGEVLGLADFDEFLDALSLPRPLVQSHGYNSPPRHADALRCCEK